MTVCTFPQLRTVVLVAVVECVVSWRKDPASEAQQL